ncbi:leucine-rich repeat-containing protein 70-like isoform X1 [Dreissena polymorpha]|uniref:Uncharacterized protein n=1 Tax=Dreissena polymorpha TaxID=45954 RepID=A0A9D4J3U2_DREPO|nr:leucine-rich repeat-containing protein 70-like isoform X1 [Dreissena polymorpha]XP_052222518.1 leucine-rich repeat-containing protein 70-like isoform X1 [Dreissena polymorpha]KAH3798801.1 hypothetical protein DPMN_152404 [Dreissena polymorpha]
MQLRSLNCSYNIYLGSNNMSQIAHYAFRGIEAHIDELYLDTNSLHSLPKAIGSIINLKLLNIDGNPIVSLNPSVMAKIGHSLKYFSVSMASFQKWPTELPLLYELYQLGLYDIPWQSLDSSAFRGLTRMESLTVELSNLTKIPNAFCALPPLKLLVMRSNYFLNESKSDVFEPCSPLAGTPHVEVIYYDNNHVDYFPNIFAMFPSVNTICMPFNGMRFMNAEKFKDNFSVEGLYLSPNQFRQIPSGLNIFKKLNILDLHDNLIEFIEDNDLIGLRNLLYFDLSYNPIQFITNKAFQNNKKLTYVDLSYTLLTTIPAAVTMLPALNILRLEANDIKCTCELASLKNWNVSFINIYGLCYLTNEPIEKFIITYIDAGKC